MFFFLSLIPRSYISFHFAFILSVQIIHFARNSRMICWREDFDAKVCGVLRKLVNVTGRNPDVIYPLQRGSLVG